jgi:hypothetical protein
MWKPNLLFGHSGISKHEAVFLIAGDNAGSLHKNENENENEN